MRLWSHRLKPFVDISPANNWLMDRLLLLTAGISFGQFSLSKSLSISIDDGQPSEMRSLPNALWVHAARLTTGRSHAHHYRVEGRILGDKRFDTAAYLDDSYPQAGVPQGKRSEQLV